MRTDQEILDQIEAVKERDVMGWMRVDLLSYLPFEVAQPFLKEGTQKKDWGDGRPRDAEAVKTQMLEYMPFAWHKANNCRGISATRSIDHMSTWLWMLGRDAAADQIQHYDQYGKGRLRAICEEFGWDWRQWDDGEWRNNEGEAAMAPPETVETLAVG